MRQPGEAMVSDLVAVIARPGATPVTVSEVERLVASYRQIRGASPRRLLGFDRARVAVFEGGSVAAPTAEAESWLAWTGIMRPTRPWTGRHVKELRNADGHFALVSYDAAAREIMVANDPMGMSAVYVAEEEGRMYVSTSALVLAKHLGCPASPLGVRSFLLSGYQFGTRTNWDAVVRLEPATCITFATDGVRRSTYWRPQIDRQVTGLSLTQAAAHGIEVLRSTCREYLGADDYCVDLTGGFDSRLLSLTLESAGVAFCTNTRSATTSDDVEIAQKIASRKGWEWHDLQLSAQWPLLVSGRLPTALAWGDAQLEVLQLARVLHAHQGLVGHRSRLLCSAGGEHFERNWESEFLSAGRSREFNIDRWIDMIAFKRGDAVLLAGDAEADVRSDFRRRLLQWVEPYADELNTTKLEMLHVYKSSGHGGAYRSADGVFLTTELPFYFKPIFSTAVSVKFRHRNAHALHRHMIDRLDHEVARLRTTHGGSALPRRPWRPDRQLSYQLGVARKVANKLTGQVLGKPWAASDPQFPWQQVAHGAVLNDLRRAGVVDWSQMRIAPLLRRDRFESLLVSALKAGFTASAALGRLITAEMALRLTDTALE